MKTRSTTPIWLTKGLRITLRVAAFAALGYDAVISFQGFLNWGYSPWSAVLMTFLIALTQAGFAHVICRGIDLGDQFESRFFSGEGVAGMISRFFGIVLIFGIVAFYLYDIGSNYAMFSGGFKLQDVWIRPTKILADVSFAVVVAIADEVLHFLADMADAVDKKNSIAYLQAYGGDMVDYSYQSAYLAQAKRRAKTQGRQAGEVYKHPSNGGSITRSP